MTLTSGGLGLSTFAGSGNTKTIDQWLMMFGDSKTYNSGPTTWPRPMTIEAARRVGGSWAFNDVGLGGATVATTLAAITGYLAAMPAAIGASVIVLINLGVNDMAGGVMPEAGTWTANYGTVLDAIHAKWPTARVYVATPWKVGQPDALIADCAARIAGLIAARPWAHAGHDERIWLKGSDNGATMTYDGTHYTELGNDEILRQWSGVLWP